MPTTERHEFVEIWRALNEKTVPFGLNWTLGWSSKMMRLAYSYQLFHLQRVICRCQWREIATAQGCHQRDDQQATPLAITASINHLNESLTSHSQEKNNRSAAAQLQWPRIVRSTRDAIARHVVSLDSRTVHEGNLVADTATKLLFTADNHPRDKLISRFPTASLIAAHQWLSDKKQWHKEIVVDATMLAVVIVGKPSLKGHWV